MNLAKTFLTHIFTGNDNESFSLAKLLAVIAGLSASYNFVHSGSVDFQGFGIGTASIIGALAVKYAVEK